MDDRLVRELVGFAAELVDGVAVVRVRAAGTVVREVAVVEREAVESELPGRFGGVLPKVVLRVRSTAGSVFAVREANEDAVGAVAAVDRVVPDLAVAVVEVVALLGFRTEAVAGRVGVLGVVVLDVVLVLDESVLARAVDGRLAVFVEALSREVVAAAFFLASLLAVVRFSMVMVNANNDSIAKEGWQARPSGSRFQQRSRTPRREPCVWLLLVIVDQIYSLPVTVAQATTMIPLAGDAYSSGCCQERTREKSRLGYRTASIKLSRYDVSGQNPVPSISQGSSAVTGAARWKTHATFAWLRLSRLPTVSLPSFTSLILRKTSRVSNNPSCVSF